MSWNSRWDTHTPGGGGGFLVVVVDRRCHAYIVFDNVIAIHSSSPFLCSFFRIGHNDNFPVASIRAAGYG